MDETVPTVEQIVREAARRGLLKLEGAGLLPQVAAALRAIVAGERPSPGLAPTDLARVGTLLNFCDLCEGRDTLAFWKPPLVAEELVEQLGFSTDQAARTAAVALWPIGFTREDLVQWAQLPSAEAEAAWAYIRREHGSYMVGTKYAAP